MGSPVLCSTGCFSRNPAAADVVASGMRRLLQHRPGTDFEVICYSSWLECMDEAAALVTAVGATTPVLHAEKSIEAWLSSSSPEDVDAALRHFESNCRLAVALGAETLVLHLWGLPDSDRRLSNNLAMLARLLDVADDHAVSVSVESVACLEDSPLRALRRVVEADSRARVTLDTAFLAMHDELEAAAAAEWLWAAGVVDHLHLKDYRPAPGGGRAFGVYLHPGNGELDLAGFCGSVVDHGFVGTVTLEASEPGADWSRPVGPIADSLDWIERGLIEQSY